MGLHFGGVDRSLVVMLLVAAALMSAALLCLLYYRLYAARGSATLQATSAGGGGGGSLLDGSAGVDEACPVVIGSLPKRVETSRSYDGKVVCLQVGRHQDLREELPFHPRYIRVAHGYSLIAFANPYFGEPVHFRMVGPMERIVDLDAWSLRVSSAVVHLSLNRNPDVEPCNAMLRTRAGQELCLQEGVHGELPSGTPALAEVQPGYRLTAFAELNLGGAPVADMVGPVRKALAAASQRTGSEREWASLRISKCGMTLYAEPGCKGRARCVMAGVPHLAWQPQSVDIASGFTLQAFSEPNFGGQLMYVATGPRQFDVTLSGRSLGPADLQDPAGGSNAWQSVRLIDTRPGGRFVTLFASRTDGGSGQEDQGTALTVGDYRRVADSLGFQPARVSVPQGLAIKAYDRAGKLVYSQPGFYYGPVIVLGGKERGEQVRAGEVAPEWDLVVVL